MKKEEKPNLMNQIVPFLLKKRTGRNGRVSIDRVPMKQQDTGDDSPFERVALLTYADGMTLSWFPC